MASVVIMILAREMPMSNDIQGRPCISPSIQPVHHIHKPCYDVIMRTWTYQGASRKILVPLRSRVHLRYAHAPSPSPRPYRSDTAD